MPQLLGQLLQETTTVQPDELDRALAEQERCDHEKLLGEILVESHACTPEQVAEALARGYGIPFARISPRLVDPAVVQALPKSMLENHAVLPLFLVDGVLTVAMAEPSNLFLLEEIRRLTGHTVQVVAATARDIRATMQAYLPKEQLFVVDEIVEEDDDATGTDPAVCFVSTTPAAPSDPAAIAQAAAAAPVVKLVNYLIHAAVKESAAEVHIEPTATDLRIRFRIDGRLTDRLRPPAPMHPAVVARLKTLATLDIAQQRFPRQGSIRVTVDGRSILLRLATLPGSLGEKTVLRIVDTERSFLRLERLGFSYDTLKAWRKLLARPSGLLLVTAPAGQGKTTTLHASLAEVGRDDANICALEDSIEHQIPGVNHFAPDERTSLNTPAMLAAILRQQPDILMLGDIADADTARLATQAALGGRLVIAGMTANDPAAAINRLNHLGAPSYILSETLMGVLRQRLVRKLCPACREAYAPTPSERRSIEHVGSAGGSFLGGTAAGSGGGSLETLYRAKGCAHCRNTGFVGRIGLFELTVIEPPMADRINRGPTPEELRTLFTPTKSLRQDGLEKIRAAITTLDEVLRATA